MRRLVSMTELPASVKMNAGGAFGATAPDHTDENVSAGVVRFVQIYTCVVDRVVRRKDGIT